MDKVKLLEKFTGQGDIREHLNQPFNLDSRTVATNGHMIISIPKLSEYSECDKESFTEAVKGILADIEKQTYSAIPDIEFPEKSKCKTCSGAGYCCFCEECDGESVVEWSTGFSWYEAECKSCAGHGYQATSKEDGKLCPECLGEKESFPTHSHVKIGDMGFASRYVNTLKQIDGIEISVGKKMLFFKGTDCCGAVMPVRL